MAENQGSSGQQPTAAATIKGIEHRSIDWVPDDERHGKLWHQAPLWFVGNFGFVVIAIGFIGPSLGLTMWWTAAAGVIGSLVGTVFMALHAQQGPVFGLPQMIQSRAQFGYRGVVVPLAAVLFTYLALNVAATVLIADGVKPAFGWNGTALALISTVCAAALAIYGHDWVHRVFRMVFYALVPLTLAVTIGILLGYAGHANHAGHYGFTWVGFMSEVTAAAALNISYAPYVSDYSRYLPRATSPVGLVGAAFAGAGTAPIWLIALGAWLATRLGATDVLLGLKQAGNSTLAPLGTVTAVLSVVAAVVTMGMNAYGGMLTTLTAVDCFRKINPTRTARVVTIIALGIAWYVIASLISATATNTLNTALTLMLYLLVPWTATNLVDFFLIRRGNYSITDIFARDGIYGIWAWRGLLSFTVGVACEIPFMVLPDIAGWSYTGPAARAMSGVDVTWLVGLAAAGITYFFVARGLPFPTARTTLADAREGLTTQTEREA
jgi:nucleobase:cation symporter-1, NCS1 family